MPAESREHGKLPPCVKMDRRGVYKVTMERTTMERLHKNRKRMRFIFSSIYKHEVVEYKAFIERLTSLDRSLLVRLFKQQITREQAERILDGRQHQRIERRRDVIEID